jgi:hypothetical protein
LFFQLIKDSCDFAFPTDIAIAAAWVVARALVVLSVLQQQYVRSAKNRKCHICSLNDDITCGNIICFTCADALCFRLAITRYEQL